MLTKKEPIELALARYASLANANRTTREDGKQQTEFGSHMLRCAALYLDSSLKCEQVGTGDSPRRLGSVRPSVSRGVARSRGSSKVRTVGRGRKPASCKVGSRRAGAEEAQ